MSEHINTDYFVDQLKTTYKHLRMSKLKVHLIIYI